MKLLTWTSLWACMLLCIPLQGQKVKKAQGEYQLRIDRTESEAEACERCLVQARINAIEKAFGTAVIQGNTTYVENTHTGEKTETVQVFNTIAETMVNGEWLRDLGEPTCEAFDYEGDRWLRCSIRGEIGKLEQPKIDFEIKALDCEQPRCETDRFKDGEDFFLYFKSPESGYLTIYLTDEHTAQRLLPYREMPDGLENAVQVKADQPYIFFSSRENALPIENYLVDEYELFVQEVQEQHRIYVIYSHEPLRKPALDPIHTDESGNTMPRSLPSEEFHKWLAKSWRYNKGMQIARLDIIISK
ncbi:MAG: hypothetical protein D6730_12980 [Bacteroidetes bacterium]|nr:MAG: hypothetical protein D6730_12980 [Bacteroidota bacterium]